MKKRIKSSLVLLVLVLSLTIIPKIPVSANGGISSNNLNKQSYGNYTTPITSYLYEDGETLSRVEYINDYAKDEKYVLVEDYDKKFNLKSQKKIELELPIWGGFYSGENYNFLVFGQSNPKEDDDQEVIRVVRYGKDWKRKGHVSLRGANTTIPFDAGSLRFDEYKDMLYIRTAHQMYKSKNDGLNHQANLTFSVNTKDMRITDSFYGVMNIGYGYVSHSFNQFIKVDKDANIVAVDHGDAYPRSIVISKYGAKAGSDKFIKGSYDQPDNTYLDIVKFPGKIGDNYTGATIGGFTETSSGYLLAYTRELETHRSNKNIYLSYVKKGILGEEEANTKKLFRTNATPHLVPTSLDDGYLLWNEFSSGINPNEWNPNEPRKLSYAKYDSTGNISGKKTIENVPLSDCEPIPYEDGILWYTTEDSEPVFYHLNEDGLIEFVPRLFGENRYKTAIEASRKIYPNGSKNVVLVGGFGEVDALTGTLLASVKDAPLLLVKKYSDVEKELKALGAENVYILGGESAVSSEVIKELKTAGYNTKRISGKDRYETAAEVARESLGTAKHAIITNDGISGSLVDALAIGPVSGINKSPILLVGKDNIPRKILEAIKELGVETVTVVGGPAVIGREVVDELEANNIRIESRISGLNRYDTARLIAKKYFNSSEKAIIVNDGLDNNSYADAVISGYIGVVKDAPILLTGPSKLNQITQNYISNKFERIYILGGEEAISHKTYKEIKNSIK